MSPWWTPPFAPAIDIGVAATAPTTLGPTTELVRSRGGWACLCRNDAVLCKGAYEALFSGDPQKHDQIVIKALCDLMERNDVIILAQASMARVAQAIPTEDKECRSLPAPDWQLSTAGVLAMFSAAESSSNHSKSFIQGEPHMKPYFIRVHKQSPTVFWINNPTASRPTWQYKTALWAARITHPILKR